MKRTRRDKIDLASSLRLCASEHAHGNVSARGRGICRTETAARINERVQG